MPDHDVAGSSSLLALPPAGAGLRGLGANFRADMYTGSGVYNIGLDLPAAQNGFRPDLALNYATGAGDGAFGLGWSVPLLAIERNTVHGVPRYRDDEDRFSLAGGEQLVRQADGTYRPRIDLKGWHIERHDSNWRVTTKDGVVHILGRSANCRIEHPASGTFSWLIEEIIAPAGQRARFSYREDGAGREIESVAYGPYRVVFEYEQRPDVFVSRRSGFPVETRFRCRQIRIESERSPAALLRRYMLSYRAPQDRPASLLERLVLEAGQLDERIAMPDLTFDYDRWDISRIREMAVEGEGGASLPRPGDADVEIIDLEGAGRPGLLQGSTAGWIYWPNLGGGRFGAARLLDNIPGTLSAADDRVRFADIEGNGTADLLWGEQGASGFFPNAAGGRWEDFVSYAQPLPFDLSDPELRLCDIDGDGKVDVIVGTADAFLLFTNEGRPGWNSEPQRIPRVADSEAFPDVSFADPHVMMADMTGDGLTDIVRVENGEIVYWPYAGHGRWGRKIRMTAAPPLPPGFDPRRVRLLDVDGDGADDFVYLGDAEVHIALNRRGSGWSPLMTVPVSGLIAGDAAVLDILGTGRPGVFWSEPDIVSGRLRHRFLSFGELPSDNLLVAVRGGLGHDTRIHYGSSEQHRQRDKAEGRVWKTFLPFPVPVVNRVENEDRPAGIRAVTTYMYHDGHFDGLERTFNGYGTVDQHTQGDDSVPAVLLTTRFHPGTDPTLTEEERRRMDPAARLKERSLRGNPLATERHEVNGGRTVRLMERTLNSWGARLDLDTVTGRVVVPFAVTAVTDEFDGATTDWRRAIVRHGEPDKHLNPTWTEHEAGVMEPSGAFNSAGRRRDIMRYVDNDLVPSAHWTPGLLCERATFDEQGRGLACVRWFYDGPDFIGLPSGAADRGVVSRIEELVFAADDSNIPAAAELATLGHHWIESASAATVSGWYRDRSRMKIGAAGHVLAARDALGNDVLIEYDAWGVDPIRTIDAAGLATTAVYDHSVELISQITQASGITEKRDYDALGRTRRIWRTDKTGALALISVTHYDEGDFRPDGAATRAPSVTVATPWNAGHDPDALAKLARFPEHALAAPVSVVRRFFGATGTVLESVSSGPAAADGKRTVVGSGARLFNMRGAVRGEGAPRLAGGFDHRPAGSDTILPFVRRYDVNGRETMLEFPGGRREQAFDTFHATITDANASALGAGAGVERTFDAFGRMVRTAERVESADRTTHDFRYSMEGWLTAIHGPGGDVLCRYEYDRLGRRTAAHHRDAGSYRWFYDALGNLVETRSPTGERVKFVYDRIMRLQRTDQVDAAGKVVSSSRFHYDRSPDHSSIAPNRLCAVEDDAGITVLGYAVDGTLTFRRRTTPSGRRLSFAYEYDHRRLLTSATYPDGTRLEFTCGAAGEVTAVSGLIDHVGYDLRGRPTIIRYANGVETLFTYDVTERPASIDVRRAGALLSRFEQDYDNSGNATRILASVFGMPEEEKRLRYDGLNRLVGATVRSGGTVSEHVYAYDHSGNVLANSEHGVAEFLYDDPARPGLLTGFVREDGERVSLRRHDAAGRLVGSEQLTSLAYDPSGRLLRVLTRGGVDLVFTYDAFGRRASATKVGPGGMAQAGIVFDDLYEEDEKGEPVLYLRGIGGLVATMRGSGAGRRVLIHHQDLQGSVRFSTDQSGALSGAASFTSFGLPTAGTARAHYVGKIEDAEIGLIQLGGRFYEPLTGRFISPDLLLLERPDAGLADPATLNLYAYAINNPYRYHDPSGRFPWLIVIAGALIGGALGYKAAEENGKDPWIGALIGAVVGGLAGYYGLIGSALKGAALGAATSAISGDGRIWTGAALGFAFGAVSGGFSKWVPPVAGDGFWVGTANALVEIGADALVGGLAAGSNNALAGRSFEDGFRSGLVMGAASGALKVAVFGVRFDPQSIKPDLNTEIGKEFARQNRFDQHGSLSGRLSVPDPAGVEFRRSGLMTWINGGRAVTFGNTVHSSSDVMDEIRNGSVRTLAHELRHIAQERAVGSTVLFVSLWLSQWMTQGEQFYQPGPGNTTLEPYY